MDERDLAGDTLQAESPVQGGIAAADHHHTLTRELLQMLDMVVDSFAFHAFNIREVQRSGDKGPDAGEGSTAGSCAIVRAHYSTEDGVALAYEGFKYWLDWKNYLNHVEDEKGLAKFMNTGSILIKSQGHDWRKNRRYFPQYVSYGVDLNRNFPNYGEANSTDGREIETARIDGDVLDLGVEYDVLEKRGAYFRYGEELLGQGRENAKTFLKENTAMALEIEDKIRAAHGLEFDMADAPDHEEDDVFEG